eukprot:TRINITY_DN72398_c0_g1_i1.p1 TRINITY_DN72398_c0_g1~~TRINITY_DN72398_c0_g1_i1.p1  ORF type:complete len:100 (-),score=12.51 TRINITY_DN72398_c0_g1_i1:78-377(-)
MSFVSHHHSILPISYTISNSTTGRDLGLKITYQNVELETPPSRLTHQLPILPEDTPYKTSSVPTVKMMPNSNMETHNQDGPVGSEDAETSSVPLQKTFT